MDASGELLISVCVLSHFNNVRLCATLWTVARQVPLSTGFSRQEYWNGLPYPPPGDLSDLEIEATSLTSPALAGGFFTISTIKNIIEGLHQTTSQKRELSRELGPTVAD